MGWRKRPRGVSRILSSCRSDISHVASSLSGAFRGQHAPKIVMGLLDIGCKPADSFGSAPANNLEARSKDCTKLSFSPARPVHDCRSCSTNAVLGCLHRPHLSSCCFFTQHHCEYAEWDTDRRQPTLQLYIPRGRGG